MGVGSGLQSSEVVASLYNGGHVPEQFRQCLILNKLYKKNLTTDYQKKTQKKQKTSQILIKNDCPSINPL